MKSIGIIRKVDEVGRIVLPVELRRKFDINKLDPMEMYTEDDCIILKKYEPTCIFCGESKDVFEFNEKTVCKKCAKELIEQIKD